MKITDEQFRTLVCKRCLIGVDDDQDGDCSICAHWDIFEASRVRNLVNARYGVSA